MISSIIQSIIKPIISSIVVSDNSDATYVGAVLSDDPVYFLRGNTASPGLDSSGNGYNFTEAGSLTLTARSGFPETSVIDNSGSASNMLSLNDGGAGEDASLIYGDMALECWFELKTLPAPGAFLMLGVSNGAGESSAGNYVWQYILFNDGGTYKIQTFHESGPGANHATEMTWNTPVANTIYHIVINRDGTTKVHSIYVNNVLIGSTLPAYTTAPSGGGDGSVSVFAVDTLSAGGLNGYACDWAIYDKQLSTDRISVHYNANGT